MKTQQLKILFGDRKLFGAIFCVIIGFVFLGFFLTKDKVDSKSDLVEINGTLQNFSFTEHNGYKSHTYSYFIYLREYNSKFQIIADFIDYFNKDYFERALKPGDRIRIAISHRDYNEINIQEKINLFGISDNRNTYLDYNDTIQQYNSKLLIYGGLIFILVGLIIFYYNREN